MAELGHLFRGAAVVILSLLITQASSASGAVARISGGTGTCITAERDALLSFKASLLDPAGHLSSWQGEDCCQWKGVRCSNRTGHVLKLNLRNTGSEYCMYENRLRLSRGEMSPSLAALQHLRYLDLSCNYFNGTNIPVFMGSLKNVRYLNLSHSCFGGRIPSQLGNLSNLQYLDVGWNYWNNSNDWYPYVVDFAWLPRLSMLSHLDMSSVDLSSVRDWVQMVNMLPALKVLLLSNCGLNNSVSATSRSNLTHLEVLDLSDNSFNTPLKHNWFWDLTSLKVLYLSSCDWHGPVPNELGNMASLQVVDLSFNYLVGLTPNTLENLCSLQVLRLDMIDLSADIGEFLSRLPRCSWNTLQVLSFRSTNMTGELPIWIGNFTNLSVLRASGNMLIGTLPAGDGALGNLTELDLSHNKFNGVLLKKHFSGLLNLEYLDLSYNSFKLAIEPNWFPPFRLVVAGFRSCQLGPNFPEWLRWQTSIEVLDLGNANLNDVIPDWFWVTFSRASFLDASGNMLHGSLPANLQHMSVDRIHLGSNKLTGQVPQLLINISRLNLSSNCFSGSLPSELKGPLLKELLLANNQITGTIPSSMCQLTGLSRLDLSGNNLTGDVMQCWKESDSKSLMFGANSANQFGSIMLSLALNNNDLTGEFPRFLQSASQLMFLDLSYNRFFGRLPEWLPEKMTHLQILRVRSNMFSGHIPKNLTCLENLHYLDVARNNISGTIPWSLSNMKAMTVKSRNTEFYFFGEYTPVITNYNFEIYHTSGTIPWLLSNLKAKTGPSQNRDEFVFEESIPVITKDQKRYYTFEIYNLLVNLDLSCNSLTGQIPEEINLLIGLINLNLSGNQLIGTIPNQIGDLKQLESLDLSYNEFSGAIPSSLSALTSLSHLNLSYNNFSGPIPSGPQLQTLDNQIYIYIGNPGLCGHPLSKNCSTNDAKQSVHEDINHIASLYLGMSIGFVIGLWTVFCTMLMKRTWMIAYFQIIDKLYDKFYIQVAIIWARLMKKTQDDAA